MGKQDENTIYIYIYGCVCIMGKEDETEVSRREMSLNYTSGKTE